MADGMERENPDQVDSPNVDVRSRDSDDTQSSQANSQNVEHDEILVSFQEITGLTDEDECRNKLQSHNWNLEMAVQSTFNENEGLPAVYQQQEHHDFQEISELPPQ